MKKTIFTDMDGVIARYERHAYTGDYSENALHENKPLFLRDPRYFASCKPDETIIDALRILSENDYKIIVLSNIVDSPIGNDHASDKQKWIEIHTPFIKEFYPIYMPKIAYAINELLKRSLSKNDILISDYNNDLIPWELGGGTGIKYINGINSPDSFEGHKVYQEWTPDKIAEKIIDISQITN